jgi:hypothetical protein
MKNTDWRDHMNNMTVAERADGVRLDLTDDFGRDHHWSVQNFILTTFGHVCANAELGRRATAEKEAHKLREEVAHLTEAYTTMMGQAFELAAQRDEARAEVERLKAELELAHAERRGAVKGLRLAAESFRRDGYAGAPMLRCEDLADRVERGEEAL